MLLLLSSLWAGRCWTAASERGRTCWWRRLCGCAFKVTSRVRSAQPPSVRITKNIMLVPVCLLAEDPEAQSTFFTSFSCFILFISIIQFLGIERSMDKCAAMSHSNGIKLQRESSSHKIITIQLERRGLRKKKKKKKLRMELELPHKVTSLDAARRFMCFSAHTSAMEETHNVLQSTTSLCCFGIGIVLGRYEMRSGVAGGEVEGQVTGIFGLLKDKISPFVGAGKCQRGNTCPASRAEGQAWQRLITRRQGGRSNTREKQPQREREGATVCVCGRLRRA